MKAHFTTYSLNGGEVSHRFAARMDIQKYLACCEIMENWFPLTLGGAKFRHGTVFVNAAKNSGEVNNKVRLVRFKFSQDQAYVLEFGDLYVRFYKDGAQIAGPLELVTPYPESMLDDLFFFQSADVMYICSDGTLQVRKLARTDDDPPTFILNTVNFNAPGTILDEPTGETGNGNTGIGTLTPGATTGTGVTFTGSNGGFVPADIGRGLAYLTSRAIITAHLSSSQVQADIIDDFPDTNPIPADEWRLTGQPGSEIDTGPKKVQGSFVEFHFEGPNKIGSLRSSDIGKYIKAWGGFVRILSIGGDGTSMKGYVVAELSEIDPGTTEIPKTPFWSIWRNAWTDDLGYPICGCFYQGRMYLARNQTVWGSIVEDFENFGLGSEDDSGISRTISDNEINDLRWLMASKRLFAGTAGQGYRFVASSDGGALTPSDFNAETISTKGSERIQPIRIDDQVIYIQYGGKKIREQVFDFVSDKFNSPDLLLLAEHITEGKKILGFDYQQETDSILWAWLDDGTILTLTYQRAEEVIAVARIVTDGRVIGLCVIPRPETSKDWVWVAVERTINTQILTYIEHFEEDADICRDWPALYTDCAILIPGADVVDDVISGLDHLEGKTVWVIGDGMLFNVEVFTDEFNVIYVRSTAVVTGGQITLSPSRADVPVTTIEVGLAYEGEIITLEPRIPDSAGGQGMVKGWAWLGMRFRKTLGLHYGVRLNEDGITREVLQYLPHRRAAHEMDSQIPLQRGKRHIPSLGHDGTGQLLVRQTLPFPAEVLSLYGLLNISEMPVDVLWNESRVDCAEAIEPPPPPDEIEPCASAHLHVTDGTTFGEVTIMRDADGIVYAFGNTAGTDFLVIYKFVMETNTLEQTVTYDDALIPATTNFDIDKNGVIYMMQNVLPSGNQLARVNMTTLLAAQRAVIAASINYLAVDKYTDNLVWISDNAAGNGHLWGYNKSTFALVFTLATGGWFPKSFVGDASGNVWVVVESNINSTNHRLWKVEPNGAIDVNISLNGVTTLQPKATFDQATNSIVLGTSAKLHRYVIGTGLAAEEFVSGGTILTRDGSFKNHPVNGKMWIVENSNFTEIDIATMTASRTIPITNFVGHDDTLAYASVFQMARDNSIVASLADASHDPQGIDHICIDDIT